MAGREDQTKGNQGPKSEFTDAIDLADAGQNNEIKMTVLTKCFFNITYIS